MTDKKHVLPHLDDNVFTVVVGNGDTSKSFVLHRNIACARSEFFRACLSDDWKESVDAQVELPEDDPDVFQVYTQSLYAGNMHQANLGHPTAVNPNSSTKVPEIDRTQYRFLADLYILSDKMVDIQAKDHAIEVIYELLSRDVTKWSGKISEELAEMITTIWETTPVDAQIRCLIVDSVARGVARGVPLRHDHLTPLLDTPPDFLVSVIEALGNEICMDDDYPSPSALDLGDYMQSVAPQPKSGKH